MSKQLHSGALRVLKPGTYDLITPGHGKPGPGLPSKCAHCLKPIRAGESWRSHFNGQYTIIYHSVCEGKQASCA